MKSARLKRNGLGKGLFKFPVYCKSSTSSTFCCTEDLRAWNMKIIQVSTALPILPIKLKCSDVDDCKILPPISTQGEWENCNWTNLQTRRPIGGKLLL